MITDDAIMRHMRIRHKQVVVTYLGNAVILLRSPVHRGEFPYRIPVADFQPGYFGRVFFVLRIFADRSKLVNTVLFTYRSRPLNNNVRPYDRTRTDFNIGAYD